MTSYRNYSCKGQFGKCHPRCGREYRKAFFTVYCICSLYWFYEGKVLLYIAIPTCNAPEILDTVRDIYGYYAKQKSMLSVTLAAGIGQQGSGSPTYGFESDRAFAESICQTFCFWRVGGWEGVVGGGTKDGSTPWGGGSARLHILWPKNNHLTDIYWLHWRALYKSAVFVVTLTSTHTLILHKHLSCSAGIFEQSMGARNQVGIGFSYRPAKLHRLPEWIPWNRFLGYIEV